MIPLDPNFGAIEAPRRHCEVSSGRRRSELSRGICGLAAALFLPLAAHGVNPVPIENAKAGTTSWQLSNAATNHEIEGYASLTSVNRGGQISFFVNTTSASYTLEIFRMGWYGGAGGRSVLGPITRTGTAQPSPIITPATWLVECNWTDPYVLTVPNNSGDPTDWASGVYLLKLTAASGKQSYIIFVVRDDARSSLYLFQCSVTTYQAYNNWGGHSYYGNSDNFQVARKVSFNRPYAPSPRANAAFAAGSGDFFSFILPDSYPANSAGWECNMLRFLEREGYDVSYCTDVDTHANPNLLFSHKWFLSVGHDEYWSWQMRANVVAARDRAVNLGFFAANVCYWQVRFEPSGVTGAANRTMVGYKDAAASDPVATDGDPSNDYLITTVWRSNKVVAAESSFIGVMYEADPVDADMVIEDASSWVCAGTGLVNGSHLTELAGYEVDRMFGIEPVGTARIAHSPYTFAGQTRFTDMTTYTAGSGATVFATGSMRWTWGLDDYNAPNLRPSRLSAAARQMTRNVLARNVGPAPSPIPFKDLALWLRADLGTVQNGGAVSQWTDQSGNERHATQGNASSRPVLVASTLNGLPVVRFDGVDDFLSFPLPVNGLGGMSVFLVAANTQNQNGGGSGAERSALFWNESAGWGTLYLSPYQSDVSFRFGTTQAGNQMDYLRPSSISNAFALSTAIKDGPTDSLYVNGQLVVSAGGKLATIAGCQPIGNVGRGYNGNTYYAGDIAEVVIYNRALTTTERQGVEQYLGKKYGLPVPNIGQPSSPQDGGVDPVGWWQFDEGGGTTALDSSGNGNQGRLTNGPVYVSGRLGGALSFDGVDDFVSVPSASSLEFLGRSFSVALWVKTSKSGPQALVEKQNIGFSGLFLLALNRDNVVPGGFSVWNGGSWLDSNFRGVTDGQWHHLAVSYDGTTFRLYRDGILDSEPRSSASYQNTGLPLNFGRFATGNVGWFLQGTLDEIRRYNRTLSSQEIAALAQVTQAPTILRTLTVNSSNPNSGVPMTVSPNDNNALAGGATSFTRSYNNNIVVTLTAPASVGGNSFVKWQRDGTDLTTNPTASIAMDADHVLLAIYQAPPSSTSTSTSTRTLTVNAVNADPGVLVSVAPAATNGLTDGTTPFQRVYALNTGVTLTAPSVVGGNNFGTWQRDGSAVATGLAVTVTMDADHTLTAVYAGGGPVGWWKLDETTGTTAFDASGWGNHGRLTNGPVFTNMARLGGGLIFDGINDYVVVADTDVLDFNNRSFTVALWVKTTKSGPQALVEKQHLFFDGVFNFALNRDGVVPGGFSVWNGGDWIDSIFRGVTDGQFHHLAVTCDRTTFRLYRDGQLDKIQASSANYANTTMPMNFGRFATGNVGWFYQGVMDDIRRYNRALTDGEISTLANPGPFPAPAAPLTEPGLRHLRLSVLASGEVVLRSSGLPNHVYRIEASRNLTDWSTIGSVEVGGDGVFEFTNSIPREFQVRFYRVVVP